jgi:hypothetical protein
VEQGSIKIDALPVSGAKLVKRLVIVP